jgi:hypothetical protein
MCILKRFSNPPETGPLISLALDFGKNKKTWG